MNFTRTRTFQTTRSNEIIYLISIDNFEEFKQIIDKNNVNNIIDTKNGYTALHYAIKFNNNRMIDLLLNLGANPDLLTLDDQDAYDISLKFQNKFLVKHILNEKNETNTESKRVISALERKNTDLNLNNKYLLKSIDEIGLKNKEIKTKLNNIEIENTGLKNSNNYVKKALSNVKTQKDTIEIKNNDLIQNVQILNNEVKNLMSINDNLNTEIKTLKRKYDSLDSSYSGLLQKIKK